MSTVKILRPDELPDLPREVRELIADGIYSLYEIAPIVPSTDLPPRFVLVTPQADLFLLSGTGQLVNRPAAICTLDDVRIIAPVLVRGGSSGVRVDLSRENPGYAAFLKAFDQ